MRTDSSCASFFQPHYGTLGCILVYSLRRIILFALGPVLLFTCVGPSLGSSSAKQEIVEPVRIGAYNFAPMSYLKDGIPSGSNVELERELMAEAGLSYSHLFMHANRIYAEIARKESLIDIWLSIGVEKVLRLGTAVEPSTFGKLQLDLMALAGTEPPKFDQFQSRALITILGLNYDGMLGQLKRRLPNMVVLAAPGQRQAYRMLKAGRAPYLLNYHASGLLIANEIGIGNMVTTSIADWQYNIYVSNNTPHADLLLKRLEAASQRILARRNAVSVDE